MTAWLWMTCLCAPAMAVAAGDLFTEIPFTKACESAQEAGRLLLVYFSEPDNAQCDAYREQTWSNEAVQRWFDAKVVAVELPAETSAEVRAEFDVRLLPTVLVLTPEGNVRARVIGFREPDVLIRQLGMQIEASDPLALARHRFEQDNGNPAGLLTYAKALEESGKIDEAVERYGQCFEVSRKVSGGYGGAQLVVIDELGRLAAENLAAKQSLMKFRDESRKRLLQEDAHQSDPAVFAAANGWLGNLDDTFTFYERLREEHPDGLNTRLLREAAVDSALKLKQYDRIASVIDIVQHAERAYEQYQWDQRRPAPQDSEAQQFRAFERKAFVDRTVKYYEILVGLGEDGNAASVASMILNVDDEPQTYIALARAAVRAGRVSPVHAQQVRQAIDLADVVEVDAVATLVEILASLDRREEAARVIIEFTPKLADPAGADRLRRILTQVGK